MSNIAVLPHQAKAAPVAQWERVTPKDAERILSTNTLNRHLSNELVKKYAAEMKSGTWDESNGESIKISVDGELLDGQHRLFAQVEADVTLKHLIVRGLAREAFKTIDCGKKRTNGDIVGIAGVKDANNVAAAAVVVMAIQGKKYGLSDVTVARKLFKRSDVIQFCLDNQAALEASTRAVSGCAKFLPVSLSGALYYLIVNKTKVKDRDEREALAQSFFKQLATGQFDNRVGSSKHPIFVLREKLAANKMSVSRLPSTAIAGLVIKTWNAYLAGRVVGVLRIVAGEAFPVVS